MLKKDASTSQSSFLLRTIDVVRNANMLPEGLRTLAQDCK